MPSPLSWQTKLADGVSGIAGKIGTSLDGLAGKFTKLGKVSTGADSNVRLGGSAKLAGLADKLAKHRAEQAATKEKPYNDALAGSKTDFAANMKHHDTVGLEKTKKAADDAAKAMDKLRAASKAASAAPYVHARTMGNTGANIGGLGQTAPKLNWVSGLLSKLNSIHPAAARAGVGLLNLASNADKSLEKLGGLGNVAGKVGGGLLSIGAFALKAAAVAGAALGGIAIAAGKYIAEIQAFKQSTMFAFQALLGSAGMAQAAWAKVVAISGSAGLSLMDTGAAFNSLLAQGFSLDAVDNLVKRMADLKAINPATNIEGIARAVAQIKTAGTLQGDELNQLAEAGLNKQLVYEELAKSMGKTVAEVKKLQSAGKITSEQALDAVNKAMARAAGGRAPGELAAEAASKTLSGAAGKFLASVQIFASSLNIDFSALGRFADRFGKVLSGDAGKRFGASIENAFARVLGILDGISEKDIAAGFDMAASTINAAAEAATSFAGAVKTVDGWIAAVTDRMGAWGMAIAVVKAIFGGIWDSVTGPIQYAIQYFEILIGVVNRLIAAISGVGAASSSLSGKFNLPAMGNSLTQGAANTNQPSAAPAETVEQIVARMTGGKPSAPVAPGEAASSTTKVDVAVKVAFDSPMFRATVTEIVQQEMAKSA